MDELILKGGARVNRDWISGEKRGAVAASHRAVDMSRALPVHFSAIAEEYASHNCADSCR